MKYVLIIIVLVGLGFQSQAQTELGDGPSNQSSWTMISFHRVWTPQFNGVPNGGFGVNFFFDNANDRRIWWGGTFTLTGIDKRSAMLLGGGAGAWLAGTGRLGVFTYLMTGIDMSSNSGITGFNFFTDPTLTVGWGSQMGLGGCVEIINNVRIHVTGMAMYLTNENGATPLGVQVGLVFGGR